MDAHILAFPYTALSVSILARFIFFILLYKNKSTNSYSLAFCILNMGSSSLWVYYSVYQKDLAMLVRSSTEIVLLAASSGYILYNKWQKSLRVAPDQPAPVV